MRRLLGLVLTLGCGGILYGQDITLDPLHGYCGGTAQCVDNGTNSPTNTNPMNFGFTISSGPLTGDFLIDILVPNNEQTAGATYSITGTYTGTATLVSSTEWTSGDLEAYLASNSTGTVPTGASPANSIGAFLPCTQNPTSPSCDDTGTGDPTASGFSVYQVDLGTATLQGPSNPNSNPLLDISTIPVGSYIVGFLDTTQLGWVATASSGAIFKDNGNIPAVPEPTSVVLLGSGLLIFGRIMRRKLS